MKFTKLLIQSFLFLFFIHSFALAADQTFYESNINDPAAWSNLNNSNGSIGTIMDNLKMDSLHNISADNITLRSNTNSKRTITTTGNDKFFTVNGGNNFTLENIVLQGGKYDGPDTSGGGAISSAGSGLTLNGSFAIERSSASHFGGGIYLGNGTLAINGTSSFSLNYAVSGNGGAAYSKGNIVFGAGSHTDIVRNDAGIHGGGLYSDLGSVTLGGSANISSNTAKTGSGGAVYAAAGVYFNGSDSMVYISSNSSQYLGGGVYSGGEIVFSGGADINKNVALMENSTTTVHYGGGLYAVSSVSFTNTEATINLEKNTAKTSGGAIYSSATVSFAGSATITSNVVEIDGGGAIWAAGNILFSNSSGTATINSNGAEYGNGGAFYSDNNINFSGYVKASNNVASHGNGGAFYSRTLNLSDGGEFTYNSAGNRGGGVAYIHDGISNFTAETRDILFENNIASGTSNDIHMGGQATLNLYASTNTSITFNGGITFDTTTANNIVNKSGGGTLFLNGISSFQTINISSGAAIIGEGSTFEAVNFSLIDYYPDSGTKTVTVLDMRNNNITDNLIVSGVMTSTTSAKIYYDIDSNTNASDKIVTETAYMDGTYVKIGIAGVDAAQKSYTIFVSTNGRGTMHIDNTNVEDKEMFRVKSYLTYFDGVDITTTAPTLWRSVDLVLSIDQLNAIGGLTENQKQAALALDRDYGVAVDDLFNIIDLLDRFDTDIVSKKKALTSLSGHVLANAITVAGLNVAKDSVLSRLKRSYFIPDDSLIKRNIWAQGYAASNKFKGDKNSPGDFSASNTGLQAGFDTMKDDTQIFGLSVGYVDTSAEQNSDTVDISGYNIGGYGAFFFENNLELKLMLIGARQNYSTSRKIYYSNSYGTVNRKANAEFDGYSINTAAELGYDYYYKDNIYFRPSLGIDYSYVTTQEFTESGANSADLTIYSGSYNRVNSNLGFQVNNGIDMRAKWYAEAKLNFLLAGTYGEFEGEFKNTAQPLKVKGIENDMFAATIGAGVLYDISKNWSAYANINGLFAGSQTGLYGNIGINYKFTTTYTDFYER